MSWIVWRRSYYLTRNIEHGVTTALRGHADDQLPGLDYFAGFSRSGDHHASGIGFQFGIAHLILGDLQLCLRGIELSLSGFAGLFGALILSVRGYIPGKKKALAIIVALSFVELRLRRCNSCLCRPQCVQFIVRFKLCYHLPRLHLIADIGAPLHHPPADAKRKTRLVFSFDASSIRDGFTDVALHDGHRPNRTSFGSGCFRFLLACSKRRRQHRRQPHDVPSANREPRNSETP